MKLSVILPCYNGGATIAVQLDALASQTYAGEWELIVVNNGSTDNSMEIVQSYRDRLPNIRIVDAYVPPGPRLGVSHSYNVGLQSATGAAFVFCEADDEIADTWLQMMAEALASHALVTGPLDYTRLNEPWIQEMHGGGAQSEELMRVNHAPYLPFAYGCNLGLRRQVYETVGEIDESFPCAWDMDYSFRAQLAGFDLHFQRGAVVHYRVRHQLKAIFRQSRNWGRDSALIRKRYRVGMGKLELPHRIGTVLFSLLRLPLALNDKAKLARSLFDLGWQVGEIEGLIQHFIVPWFVQRQKSAVFRKPLSYTKS